MIWYRPKYRYYPGSVKYPTFEFICYNYFLINEAVTDVNYQGFCIFSNIK
jgi:hypothetical protein